jgi:uncharacterized DUF497 family protein
VSGPAEVEPPFEDFEWDEHKSQATLDARAFDFEFAVRLFDGLYRQHEDRRRDYGEQRFITTGAVDGLLVTVVWTPRGRRRRIISAWPASNRERRQYRDYREALERRGPNE